VCICIDWTCCFPLVVGPSIDPSGVSFIDCIKVYCKAKDVFGWTERSAADAAASAAARAPAASAAKPSSSSATDDSAGGLDDNDELLSVPINTQVFTSTDLYVCVCACVCMRASGSMCTCVCVVGDRVGILSHPAWCLSIEYRV